MKNNAGGGPSYRRKVNSQGCIKMYYKLIQPVLESYKELKILEIVPSGVRTTEIAQ